MIIELEDAREIDISITQEDLDGFEQSVRALTNNNFQNRKVRLTNVEIAKPNIIRSQTIVKGMRTGDTLEINYSDFNDGLFVVESILDNEIKVKGAVFFSEKMKGVIVTKVEYPADIKQSIKKLIAYDKKMAGKIGVKSETISRMSTTYYDVNTSENTDGYPASLLSFLKKYEKMRW